MMRIAILAGAAVLAGCTTLPASGAGRCDAAAVRQFTGTLATADLAQVLLKRSGARTIRWLQPNSMATMDYRQDRLNVRLDARNFILETNCG